ncbi:hypothetical protein [Maribacter sp. 2307ULW6-5]
MGEYITAFATEEEAKKAQARHQGELFSWESLKTRFKL